WAVESFFTESVFVVPKLFPANVPPRTVASAAGDSVNVPELLFGATCNSSIAQSTPMSPCTATLNCPFVNESICPARSSTRTVVLVPVEIGSQPRPANVKLFVVLFRYNPSPLAELVARIARDSVAATTCSLAPSEKVKVNGTQWLLVTTSNASGGWPPAAA